MSGVVGTIEHMFATVALSTANSYELLETMEPGPELAGALDSVERDRLSADELVSVMVAHRRLASHYMGESYRDVAAIEAVTRDNGESYHHSVENTATEIAAALCLTRRSAEAEAHLALELTRRLPAVLWALVGARSMSAGPRFW